MHQTMVLAIAAAGFAASVATTARAEDVTERVPDYLRQNVRAPSHAFEIGVDTGYQQGFGSLSAARPLDAVAGAGATFGLSLGYRATPVVYVGWRGSLQRYSSPPELAQGATVSGLATSVAVDFHLAPHLRLDPWVGVGTGYRRVTVSPEGGLVSGYASGLELLKLRAGFDVRVNNSISIGPMIGADLDDFVWTRPMGIATTSPIADRRLSTFIYAGIGARFDVTGMRVARPIIEAIDHE
jgi:hypothetical protein